MWCETLSDMASDDVVTLAPDVGGTEDILSQIDDSTSCVVVQTPDVFGNVRDLKPIADKAHQHGALLIAVFTEVVSLGLLEVARQPWAPTSWWARGSRSATR